MYAEVIESRLSRRHHCSITTSALEGNDRTCGVSSSPPPTLALPNPSVPPSLLLSSDQIRSSPHNCIPLALWGCVRIASWTDRQTPTPECNFSRGVLVAPARASSEDPPSSVWRILWSASIWTSSDDLCFVYGFADDCCSNRICRTGRSCSLQSRGLTVWSVSSILTCIHKATCIPADRQSGLR